jgi:tetratricopeptide (TPR) repeat protein
MMFRFSRITSLCLMLLLLAATLLPALSGFAEEPVNADSARRFMQSGQWEAANYAWRHILQQDPQNVEATVGLAESLMKTGYQQEAISLLEAIPQGKRVLYSDLVLARAYASVNEFVKSRDLYLKILATIPFQMDAFRELLPLKDHFSGNDRKFLEQDLNVVANAAKTKGDEAIKAKNYRQASNFYELAATQLNTVGLVNDYGILLLLVGQYVKAHDQFAILKGKDKLNFSEADSNAAIASLSIGNVAEAKTEMKEAINESKDDKLKAKLYNNLGYIHEMTRHRTDAKFAYQHAIELDPTLSIAQMNLAYVQQADREFEEAIANYRQILTREPARADVWNKIGFVYELQFKSKPALAAYKKAVEVDPKNKDAYYNLSALYKKMGNVKEANASLKKVAEMNYREMESKTPKAATPPADSPNKILKFVLLFPSQPQILAGLQS